MIAPLVREQAPQIAKIHFVSLPDNFLPSLGIDFLEKFYEGIIEERGVFGYVDVEGKKIRGFILGTDDMNDFFIKALKNNFFQLTHQLVLKILKKPIIIKKILETFLYPKKEVGPRAELIVIAVLKRWQGQGIGKRLIATLEKKFLQRTIKKYKLTVHADKKAVYFYEKLGYRRLSSFNLYDKMWYVYDKKIT